MQFLSTDERTHFHKTPFQDVSILEHITPSTTNFYISTVHSFLPSSFFARALPLLPYILQSLGAGFDLP